MNDPGKPDRRLALKLAGLGAGMFAFGFALVPLYDAFCALTGLGGKTAAFAAQVAAAEPPAADPARTVRMEFLASRAAGAPWEFRAANSHLDVVPGQVYETTFVARNMTDTALVAQAVPSVAPGLAAQHLDKLECFCFTTQPFAAREERQLKLVFRIDPELPAHLDTLSLSYTLFKAPE